VSKLNKERKKGGEGGATKTKDNRSERGQRSAGSSVNERGNAYMHVTNHNAKEKQELRNTISKSA
jgi:hypothetical protein